MAETKEKVPKLKGFAGFINNLIIAAIKLDECKEFIRGIKTRVLLNNLQDKWAVIITIKDDQVKVEGINKDENPDLSRKKWFYYGYWEFPDLQTMMGASGWKLGKWIRKMARGKVKGASQIAIIGQILAYAAPKKTPEEDKKLKLKM